MTTTDVPDVDELEVARVGRLEAVERFLTDLAAAMAPEDRTYAGCRVPVPEGGGSEASVWVIGPVYPPAPLRHPAYHSPDGFEWGYAGSGPADLALAMLVDAFDEWRVGMRPDPDHFADVDRLRLIERTRAWSLHQAFKRDVVARFSPRALDVPVWLCTRGDVLRWARTSAS